MLVAVRREAHGGRGAYRACCPVPNDHCAAPVRIPVLLCSVFSSGLFWEGFRVAAGSRERAVARPVMGGFLKSLLSSDPATAAIENGFYDVWMRRTPAA